MRIFSCKVVVVEMESQNSMRRKADRNFGVRPASVSLANPLRHLEGGLELRRYIQSRSLIFFYFLFLHYTLKPILNKYITR